MLKIRMDSSILAQALQQFRKDHHGKAPTKMLQNIGGHNIKRIESGQIEPTIDTWLNLHMAYPKWIPPPTTVNGGIILYAGPNFDHPLIGEKSRTIPGELELQRLYSKHRSHGIVKVLLAVLTRFDKVVERECQKASQTT